MDINFHYFAVKAITVKGGFCDDDAQVIASYSQFVDDFSNYRYMFFKDVPEFAQYLAIKVPFGWLFDPVTTGFDSFFELARLALEKNQKRILIPFHFIPANKKLNQKVADRTEWRVIPARMDLPSLIQNLLLNAQADYKADKTTINLIRIGTLMHIFADTYAHQNFSGYWNWENHSKLTSATNNVDESNILSSYEPDKYFLFPSIGHTNVNHAPDDSNISLGYIQKLNENDDYSIHYSRSNTREYLVALKEIINYMRACNDLDPIDQNEWNELSQLFAQGLLTPVKDKDALSIHWHNIFPDINFYYNKQNQYDLEISDIITQKDLDSAEYFEIVKNIPNIDGQMYTATSDIFFHYNVIADQIRTFVNGEEISDAEWNAIAEKMATY